MKLFIKNSLHLNKILFEIITTPFFITITLLGNLVIISFSCLFYFIESPQNNSVNHFLDAVWWGFATSTTVGYGDIIPLTSIGKIVGIILMLIGTALFAIYTGLFAKVILESKIFQFNIKDKSQEKN